jgi:hypothetical protein
MSVQESRPARWMRRGPREWLVFCACVHMPPSGLQERSFGNHRIDCYSLF